MRARLRARLGRARLVMDHYPQVNGVCMFLFMSSSAWPRDVWPWVFWPVAVALCVFVFGRANHHPIYPCCIERWPNDPQAYVRRHAHALRIMHFCWDGPWRLTIIAASYMVVMVSFMLWVPVPVNRWTAVIVPASMIAPVLFLVQCSQIHRNALLCCPHCWRGYGGNDDDEIPEPEPDPVPVGTKELQPA